MNQSLLPIIQNAMPTVRSVGLMTSLCGISKPGPNLTASGAPSAYVPVDGLQDIVCKDSPVSDGRIMSTEQKSMASVLAIADRHVLLDRYYEVIEAGWRQGWHATIDGTEYDIIGAESDGFRIQTRMYLRRVTV